MKKFFYVNLGETTFTITGLKEQFKGFTAGIVRQADLKVVETFVLPECAEGYAQLTKDVEINGKKIKGFVVYLPWKHGDKKFVHVWYKEKNEQKFLSVVVTEDNEPEVLKFINV